jgi:hypothetical protein
MTQKDVKDSRELLLEGQKTAGTLKSAANPTDLSSHSKRE